MDSYFPREFNPERAAVPFGSMTDVVTVDCEVLGIEVQNSTSATIQLTVQDKLGSPKKLLDAVDIAPNVPFLIGFSKEGRCKGGVSWQASATGLVGRMWGMRLTGWTMDANGFVQTMT